ncbi:MAG: TolC family protein [Desulfosalsimonadaceae bacterium]
MNRFCGTALKRRFFIVFSLMVFFAFPLHVRAEGEREVTLEEAYHSALRHNEQILASGHRVDQAKEDIRIAKSPLFPQVQLRGRHIRMKETTYQGLGITGPDHYNEASIQGSQVLFQGGKLRIGIQASRYVAESGVYEDYRTRQQILFAVSNSFYNVLFARRSTDIAESQLTRSNQHLELARQRQEVGLVDMTAVLRARVQVAAAMEALEEARNNYTVAKERLALEMGIPTPPDSVKEPETIEMEDATVDAYIEYAFQHRQDLLAAEKWLLAAESNVKAERRDFFPSLSVEGSYSMVDEDLVYEGDDYNWQAALVASLPLFTGFKNTADVAKARAAESEMQAAYNRAKQEIRLDVRQAYADIQTRKKMIRHLNDQVDSARANYEQVSAKFEEGLASTVDLVDADTALNEAELSMANVYYRLQLDHLSLKLATGEFLQHMLQ